MEQIVRDKFPSNGGWKFRQPQFGPQWQNPMALVGFDASVKYIQKAREKNKALSIKHGLSTNYDSIADELISYNRSIRGIAAPAPPSFFLTARRNLQDVIVAAAGDVKKMWIGAETVIDCTKENPVSKEQANSRARICAGTDDASKCPKNGKGDLTRWFTMPLSEAIRKAESSLRDRHLQTDYDDKLGVCDACLCPLKLKVHCNAEVVQNHLDSQVKSDLDPRCWILSEAK